MVRKLQNYVDGKFVPSSGSTFEITNPATHELLAVGPDSAKADVDAAVEAATRAQPAWEALPGIVRANHLREVSAKLRQHKDRLAETITREQGKVLGLAKVEIDFTANYIDYMAEWARRIEGEIVPSDRPGEHIFVLKKPIGVVAGVLPWNFPFFLIARKMAPALVTGNTIVIKSSEETPINAMEFTELLAETSMPPGVFNMISGRGATTGNALTTHKDIGIVSFTGSVETGARIMQAVAPNLTRVNLELGGKAPVIVLADCDLDKTAAFVHASRVINTGQACNCAERVYVERGIAEQFADKVRALMAATSYGDPMADQSVSMGPMINKAGVDKIAALVDQAKKAGAQAITGGKVADVKQGFHYEPTVLFGCKSDMDVMKKELFGPVLPIQVVDGLDEAIALANDSDFGLTSSIHTRDLSKAWKAVRELRFGETYINREHFEAMQGYHAGRKKSGIGGADGKYGMLDFVETHVVYMQTT